MSTTSAIPTGRCSIKEGVPLKVVSERLGHANVACTIQTYQHVLPGMQADAARLYERLTAPVPPGDVDSVERRGNRRRRHRLTPVARANQQRRPRSLTWAFNRHLVAG